MWDAIPAPAKAGGVPQELTECDRFIAFMRTQTGPERTALIVANAGNWPIAHLALRAKVAAGRDKFDPSTFKAKQTLKLGPLQAEEGRKAVGDRAVSPHRSGIRLAGRRGRVPSPGFQQIG